MNTTANRTWLLPEIPAHERDFQILSSSKMMAVVGEVSAGAALKPGPGADPSEFPSVPSPLEPQPCPGTR